jgi:hypothetical protein
MAKMGNEMQLKQSGIAECVMDSSGNNKYQFNFPLTHVTITHPQHPLRGQRFEIIEVNQGDAPSITIRHPDGTQNTIPLGWTDYVDSSASALSSDTTDTSHLLDIKGLLDVVRIIAGIKSGDLEASP